MLPSVHFSVLNFVIVTYFDYLKLKFSTPACMHAPIVDTSVFTLDPRLIRRFQYIITFIFASYFTFDSLGNSQQSRSKLLEFCYKGLLVWDQLYPEQIFLYFLLSPMTKVTLLWMWGISSSNFYSKPTLNCRYSLMDISSIMQCSLHHK